MISPALSARFQIAMTLAIWLIDIAGPTLRAADASAGFLPSRLAAMETAITNAIAEKRLPGAVLWVERNGTSHHRSFGQRALVPAPEPMSEDTVFDAASLTKVVAGTPAVMLLVERGRLALNVTAQTYLPEFKGDGKEAITLRQLLTHTSGLRPDIDTKTRWEGSDTAIRMACAEKLQAPPGTVFRYSDINFFLLGEIVRRASGSRLDEFVAKEIYQPLKMEDTGFRPPRKQWPRVAPTESVDGAMLRGVVHDPTARYMGGVAGHAGLFTTASDLARYARMLLNGGELEGNRIFLPGTIALMTSVQTPTALLARRGLGWDIDSAFSRPRGELFPLGSYGHTGFTGTALWIDPFSRTFWILLSNRVHPEGRGNILPLQYTLGTLAAEAMEDFDFANVPGALPMRTNYFAQTAPAAPLQAGLGTHRGSGSRPELAGVLNGIDVLVKQNFAPLKKKRIGLITNHTGLDRWRNPTIDLLFKAPGVNLKALFSPEHGLRGELDDQVTSSVDAVTGLPIHSLYPKIPGRARGQTERDYNAMAMKLRQPAPPDLAGLDALVFDIQDIGCRFYTYSATLGLCLEAASLAQVPFIVLDRVNPVNGTAVEGPLYRGDPSFTAFHSIPLRHGMTLGELAGMYNVERGFNAALTVIPVEGWKRNQWFDATALPWRHPSPNMRSLAAATLYPGVGLHESALSVGRGTDKPFEIIGAPYIDDVLLSAALNKAGLPGIRFLPMRFTPTYSTFKDQECGGAAMLITNRDELQAVDVGIVIALVLRRLYPNEFALQKVAPLLKHPDTIEAIKSGKTLAAIKESWAEDLSAFQKRRSSFLLYP